MRWPGLRFRTEGFLRLDEGKPEEARENFLKAARYADKPAQAMLAEMAWKGLGQEVDRALAYAWADIAAERGYPQLVAVREAYWTQMDVEERQRAVEVGLPLLEEYGDHAAKPRLALQLRRARQGMISKRPRKDVEVQIPGPNGQPITLYGHHFYAEHFWNPERYQEWVDETWQAPGTGTVEVGRLEQASDEP